MCSLYDQTMLQYPLSLCDARTCLPMDTSDNSSETTGTVHGIVSLSNLKILLDNLGFFEGEVLTFITFIRMFSVLISGLKLYHCVWLQ